MNQNFTEYDCKYLINNKHWGKYWKELQQNNSAVIKMADCGCLFFML